MEKSQDNRPEGRTDSERGPLEAIVVAQVTAAVLGGYDGIPDEVVRQWRARDAQIVGNTPEPFLAVPGNLDFWTRVVDGMSRGQDLARSYGMAYAMGRHDVAGICEKRAAALRTGDVAEFMSLMKVKLVGRELTNGRTAIAAALVEEALELAAGSPAALAHALRAKLMVQLENGAGHDAMIGTMKGILDVEPFNIKLRAFVWKHKALRALGLAR